MNLLVYRRHFLLGASAYSLAGCLAPGGAVQGDWLALSRAGFGRQFGGMIFKRKG